MNVASVTPAARRVFIEDHRWLVTIFGARSLGTALAFSALVEGALLWTGLRAGTAVVWPLVAAGVLYWSFVEYAMHRWFYHWRPRHPGLRRVVESFHVYHHRTIDDRAVWNAGPALVVLLTLLLGLPPLLLLGDLGQAAWVMAGAVPAYALYETVHHECHARRYRRGPMAALQRFHLHHHHRDWRRNYGVTNPLWDWLFRTFSRPEAR